LLLRDQNLKEVMKDVNVPPNQDGTMTVKATNLPAGTYYIQLFTSGSFNQSQLYTLRMTR
jgi:hypothetical protein